jgi:ABC-2 type transport system ATP-binding protein
MNNAAANKFPIHLTNVTRRFGKLTAVEDLTLRISAGTTFGFIGLNGAGKTTAIRMMVGLLRPDSGVVQIEGIHVPRDRDQIKSLIGYVPDRLHVYPWMRVSEAIAFVRAFYPYFNEQRLGELLKMFQLDPGQRVKHLSKGQGAKLSLLLAICHDPKILILDEPTSGMDSLVREEFLEGVLAVTSERNQTVLFSSHTLSDVQRLADTVGLLHNGRLLLHKPVDELLDRTKRIRAVLEDEGSPHRPPPGHIWQQIRGREWLITMPDFSPDHLQFVRSNNRIAHLDVQDMSLDDVFKDLVRGQQKENAA